MNNKRREEMEFTRKRLAILYKKWMKEQKEIEKSKKLSIENEKEKFATLETKLEISSVREESTNQIKKKSLNSKIVYKLKPKYLTTDFNFDSMSATVTEIEVENNFKNVGVFRTKDDLVGMAWQTKDVLGHVDFRYPEDKSFAGIKLAYDYEISGFTPLMDESQAPVLTVKTYSGEEHFVRLWNYVMNRQEDDWEKGSGYYFPLGRKVGMDTGAKGTILINFDELYAGWSPFYWESTNNSWQKNLDWVKVPIDNIKEIMWSIAPKNFGQGAFYLDDSKKYEIKFKNWTVTGNNFLCNEPNVVPILPIRICDGYDDIYNMTPERVISEYTCLGYGETVNMYIGASHYYDKKYDREDRKLNILKNYPFNVAFEEWYKNYIHRLKRIGVQNLIHSVSMENVNPPESWKQRAWNGKPAATGWTPTPYLLSFTNQEVKNFYKKYVFNLAKLSKEAGIRPIIQLGEPWWWFIEDGQDNLPCFYDESTKQMYLNEYGKSMHIFRTGNDPIEGYEDILYFLRDKNGEFSQILRDHIKLYYPDALFTVLFFPPSVMDKNRVPMKMSIANFPKEHWKSPNLDFFMLEDYDYLVDNHMDKHDEAIIFVQNNLGYDRSKIHYFSGFVLNQEKLEVWNRIDQAINDSFNQGFAETYIWAYAQVKRDGWRPQNIIYANKPSGNYKESINITLSCSEATGLKYTLDGSIPSSSNGDLYSGSIHINKTTLLTVISIKNGIDSKPIRFKYTIPVKLPIDAKINIDGNVGEWFNITAISIGDRRIFDFSAVQSLNTLFILVRGSEMDTSSNLYIDVNKGDSLGFRTLPWIDGKAGYMVSNDIMFKYIGTGQDWAWEEIGRVQIAKNPSVVEIEIPLKLLGLEARQEIKLGFGRKFEDFAPMSGNKMVVANKAITEVTSTVLEIHLSISELRIAVNDVYYIKVIVMPPNTLNPEIIWSSSNTEVAIADHFGKIHAKNVGEAIITVSSIIDSSKYATCVVTVPEVMVINDLKVYQSPRWPGKEKGPTSGTALDMLSNDKTKSELNDISPVIGEIADLYHQLPDGHEDVKKIAKGLATTFTNGNISMRPIVKGLFDHFFDGSGTPYRNDILTEKVLAHASTQKYINNAKKTLIEYIRKNKGNPNGALNDNDLKEILDEYRPQFDTLEDRWNGLTISINDTWGNYINIKNYQFDGIIFTGTLKFTIYDHFGLDDGDVTGDYGGLAWIFGWYPEFAAWYVLQRYKGCDGLYQPFINYFEAEVPFNGVVYKGE